MRVLVVEDEAHVSAFIRQGLVEQGHEVVQAFDGKEGLQKAVNQTFDVIMLDVVMPGMNGLEVCQTLRREHRIDTPILMLTALGATEDVVTGLDAGADDYLPKPFKFNELVARLRALGRRSGSVRQTNQLTTADLVVDLDEKSVVRAGQEVSLTAREFNLLVYLLRNEGRVVSRMSILENVWEVNFDVGTNVVDVYVNYLRKKVDKPFDQKLIHTVVGMGYILKTS